MLLVAVVYHNHTFYAIVSTRNCTDKVKNERYGLKIHMSYKKANKLLLKADGIKTGTTKNTWLCPIGHTNNYLITVSNCDSHLKRFQKS
jgi:D-alanyl-D-alanine carboxypeptidase